MDAVDEALARHGRPEIFNTDQGSQFTSAPFTRLLSDNLIKISMDGRGSWRSWFLRKAAPVTGVVTKSPFVTTTRPPWK